MVYINFQCFVVAEIVEDPYVYPNNLTYTNALKYFVLTPAVAYKPFYPERTKPKWKSAGVKLIIFCICHTITMFLARQLLLPELGEFLILLESGSSYIALVPRIAKLMVFMHSMFLVYTAYIIFQVFLPLHGDLTGMPHVKYTRDWWNSAHMNVYWREWNLPVYNCLKNYVYIPVIENGYSKYVATFATMTCSGLLHEYLVSVPPMKQVRYKRLLLDGGSFWDVHRFRAHRDLHGDPQRAFKRVSREEVWGQVGKHDALDLAGVRTTHFVAHGQLRIRKNYRLHIAC